jgi:NTP pyrophosphatase (non-canonical NTP hydrolase)
MILKSDTIHHLILLERERQNRLHPFNNPSTDVSDTFKLSVMIEEVGEVARAILDGEPNTQLMQELVQVAAVATAWLESIIMDIDYNRD